MQDANRKQTVNWLEKIGTEICFLNNFHNFRLIINKQSGAVEACWAHNPEVRRSKLRSARNFYFFTPNNFLLFNLSNWYRYKNLRSAKQTIWYIDLGFVVLEFLIPKLFFNCKKMSKLFLETIIQALTNLKTLSTCCYLLQHIRDLYCTFEGKQDYTLEPQ